jgi:tetratricopeptide (TPR) repeat protein
VYQFSLLVTGQRDAKLQAAARKLDKASRAKKSFGIEVLFWDDIKRIYDRHPDAYARHYDDHGRAKRRPNNQPFPPNPYFTGREAMMEDLAARLAAESSEAVITQPQAVHGLGGVGKTQLAVEYAWANRARYDALLWAVADSPTNLLANLAALAADAVLDLPERDATDQSVTVTAVLRWLRDNPRWLLILDSVDSPEAAAAVCKLLSPPLGGHVIVTTRRQTDWPPTVTPVNVDVLSDPAAADFLCGRITGHAPGPRADAEKLAHDLGGLPLALEQAAAYILKNRITFAQYRDRLATQRPEILAAGTHGGTDYKHSVAETWLLSEQQLSPPARALLRLMAFFAPDAMPRAMLAKAGPILRDAIGQDGTSLPPKGELNNHETQAPDADAALVELHEYSLVGLTPESVSCHRLLQAVLRDRMSSDQRRQTALAALLLVGGLAVSDSGDTRTWPVWTPLAPHVQAAATLADESGITDPAAEFMSHLAVYYHARAQHGPAEPLMRRALEIGEKSFGPEHPKVAIRMNNLAALLQATNRLAEAEPLLRRALKIDETSFGPEHPNVAIRLNNLAQLLQATGRLAEAEPLIRRAVVIFAKLREVTGHEHPYAGAVEGNYRGLLVAMGLEEAEVIRRVKRSRRRGDARAGQAKGHRQPSG